MRYLGKVAEVASPRDDLDHIVVCGVMCDVCVIC